MSPKNCHPYAIRMANWREDGRALRIIRETVFINEQGVPVELEWDGSDANCVHALATDARENPIGTARLLPDGSIGRLAVLKEWRRKGVGSALLQWVLREARNRQIHQVVMNAQTSATEFYIRFGFRTEGKEFLDAGIPHIRMVLRLPGRPA